jgi:hypothetical protein
MPPTQVKLQGDASGEDQRREDDAIARPGEVRVRDFSRSVDRSYTVV